jgi:hypothetical protein
VHFQIHQNLHKLNKLKKVLLLINNGYLIVINKINYYLRKIMNLKNRIIMKERKIHQIEYRKENQQKL